MSTLAGRASAGRSSSTDKKMRNESTLLPRDRAHMAGGQPHKCQVVVEKGALKLKYRACGRLPASGFCLTPCGVSKIKNKAKTAK